MSSEERADTKEPVDVQQVIFQRDIEQEITYSLIFNWFIGLPVIIALFIFLTITISKHYVTEPFIDEIFHIPQTLQYIQKGDFKTWDNKITTPPGLYYIGYIFSKVISLLHLPVDASSITVLRLVNTLGGVIVLPLVLNPIFKLNPISFWISSIILFPPLSMFYTLYYTDVWSAIMVLASLSVAITLPFGEEKSIIISSIISGLSLFFRQTNIVWNFFILVIVIERRAIIHKNFTNLFLNNCIKFFLQFFEDFVKISLPYLVNGLVFLIFLIYNRGITLGDKDNHKVGLHIMQFFYCLTMITVFTLPLWISDQFIISYYRRCKRMPILLIVEYIGIFIIIRFFTVVHPFLLADNRHYTFYIWKKIINYTWISKYLISPVYHFAIYTTIDQLYNNGFYFSSTIENPFKTTEELPFKPTGISIIMFFICTFITIVPSPLFEPRYYILPYLIFRLMVEVPYQPVLRIESKSDIILRRLAFEFSYFLIINVITFLIYIFYTFKWENESQLQRIIW